MAFTDANGKITIDDVALNHDIQRLISSKNDLIKVKDELQTILNLNSSMLGPTADSINETTLHMLNSVNKNIDSIDDSVLFLKKILSTYEAIDRNNKTLTEQMGG